MPDTAAPTLPLQAKVSRVRFDRNELSGAFGDIGTDFPLVVGMILASGLDAANVLTVFGLMQIGTGLFYGMPMPAQPLKAMAAIVIAQKLSGGVLFGGGLAIGIVMLLLSATGLIDVIARVVPKVVVRGIQFGLGLQLSSIALQQYVSAEGWYGYILAGVSFAMVLALLGNRKLPPAPFVIGLGIVYAIVLRVDPAALAAGAGFHLPQPRMPSPGEIWTGFVLLAIPQIPLSLGNSILATRQIATDLFPERPPVTVRKIGFTYAMMNLISPFLGGIPTCHGSGGMAGHYAFGARTGGSVVLYGSLYLVLGLFLSGSFQEVILLFPKPVLGVILVVEALALMLLVRDMTESKSDFWIALVVGVAAVGLPYGYVVALVLGTILAALARRGLTGIAR